MMFKFVQEKLIKLKEDLLKKLFAKLQLKRFDVMKTSQLYYCFISFDHFRMAWISNKLIK
jgi:hypothetical protein